MPENHSIEQSVRQLIQQNAHGPIGLVIWYIRCLRMQRCGPVKPFMNETYQKLQPIFEDIFDETIPLSAESSAVDFKNWDSLGNIRLFMAIETAYGIKFKTSEITGLKNVGELVDTIEARVRQAGRS